MITEEQKEKYLKNPHYCPYCKGADIDTMNVRLRGNDSSEAKIECENCGKSWIEVYTLSTIREVDNDNN